VRKGTNVVQPDPRDSVTVWLDLAVKDGRRRPAPPDLANRIADYFERAAGEGEAEPIGQKRGAAAVPG
jgi:hypothetical protein